MRPCEHLETIHATYRAVVICLVARLIGVTDAGWSRHARLAQEAVDAKIELAVFIMPADPSAPHRLDIAMDGHHSGLDEGWSLLHGWRCTASATCVSAAAGLGLKSIKDLIASERINYVKPSWDRAQ
jgi:hypothetical protein